ncbi:MAG: nucleotidyl transferase AbiEii/AbiGii toxin family protein [Planctomycetota bacterium]
MSGAPDGLARSIQVRLVQHAKGLGVDPNLVLTRYALERLLYRLSESPHVEQFALKGGLLLLAWLGEALRPTRDADLLSFGDLSVAALARIFVEVCEIDVEPDAMTFLADTVSVVTIRVGSDDGGYRVTIESRLGAARLRVQVDVGIGDVVTPETAWLHYPGLLDLPRPRLRAYSRESVMAEKLHAVVVLGAANSRMKDYFDLHGLLCQGAVSLGQLERAIAATFERRGTAVPSGVPVGLTDAFAREPSKQAQWKAFLAKNRLKAPRLEQVVADIRGEIAGTWRAVGEAGGR